MTDFLEIALACIARGWYVFPCKPRTKEPRIAGGFKSASNNEQQVRAWWAQWPNANVAIATGASGLTVLDLDHGINSVEDVIYFLYGHDLPRTYAVRTGRRDSFGVQLYYSGGDIKSIAWEMHAGAVSGDVRSSSGYVMAAGCIHPDSGEAYEVLWDDNVNPTPAFVRGLKAKPLPGTEGGKNASVVDDGGLIADHRNVHMISLLGRKRVEGADDDALRAYALQVNETRMVPPLDEDELERLIANACNFPLPEAEPEIILGGKVVGTAPNESAEPVDWRTRYLTYERVRDARPIEFLIRGFLALDSITALAAPVGQRKSLIALNVAHALCTGEKLFDYFEVEKRPGRVIYLCPEMGLSSFSTRLKQIGLASHVGEMLFCQTMDEESVKLADLDEELPGGVVIIDTLTRFVEGDQNSSEDMSRFAKVVFGLKRRGATVLLLHHSVKGASQALTLDSAMRGSTELAAFVTCCWATRLKDPDDPYNSPSVLVNVKQRDFESKPFEVTSGPDCRLHITGEPGMIAEIKSQADADAEKVLAAILKDSPKLGINKIQEALRAAGHKKGVKWVTRARAATLGTGVALSA